MNGKKKGLITALILIIAGLLLAGVSLASVGFDFSKLSTTAFVTNTCDVSQSFRNIKIIGDTENIEFLPSDDGACRVVCREREDEPHRVEAADGTLTVENISRNKWHFLDFSFMTEGPSITLHLPEEAYSALEIDASTGDVKIPGNFSFDSVDIRLSTGDADCRASAAGELSVRTSTGQISLSDLTAGTVRLSASTGGIRVSGVQCAGDMNVSVSTGRTLLENVKCRNLVSTGSTGGLTLTNVIAGGSFNLDRSTGDIRFETCDAAEIKATTDTGSIKGSLLTDKVFIAHSDTGRVDVPKMTSGGKCELSTDTGSIEITVQALP